MLAALGAVFLDKTRQPITTIDGGSLQQIRSVDTSGLTDLSHIDIVIASDVQNPLTGSNGAAAVYGPQKGATPAIVHTLDAGRPVQDALQRAEELHEQRAVIRALSEPSAVLPCAAAPI